MDTDFLMDNRSYAQLCLQKTGEGGGGVGFVSSQNLKALGHKYEPDQVHS
jgi:hypothetical protein